MAEELKNRKEIPEELTWDLSGIYATETDMYRDAEEMKRLAAHIAETYKGSWTRRSGSRPASPSTAG